MDLKTEIGREWLRRIVLLLLSFAGLAEQASVRAWRVRRNVLAILRRGETAAFWIVSGAARDCGAPLPLQAVAAGRHWKFDDDGDDPENALRLAHRFRALAVALTLLLALAEQQAEAGPAFRARRARDANVISGRCRWFAGSGCQPAVLVPP